MGSRLYYELYCLISRQPSGAINFIINLDLSSGCGMQCRSWSVGFIRTKLIWIYTVFKSMY